MAREISNQDDTLDSRDIIARIEELQGEREDYTVDEYPSPEGWAKDNPEDAEELAALEALQEEAEGYCPDWRYGAQLIRESYWVEYAQQLAEDIGALEDSSRWPCYCIDWERAARELAMDYTLVNFDGVDYYVR